MSAFMLRAEIDPESRRPSSGEQATQLFPQQLFDRKKKSYTTVGATAVQHEPVKVWKRFFFQFLFVISCKLKHFE